MPILRNKTHRLIGLHLGIAGMFTILLMFALQWGPSREWVTFSWLASWLVAINLSTFAYYGFDKFQARTNGSRVPEVVLHLLVVLGGAVGAYLAMQLFRHKTIKGRFRLVFWAIVAVQFTVLLAWMLGYW